MSSSIFHLAIEAGDLSKSVPWYRDVLGCRLDMHEEGRWQDIDFWGNELTLHESEPRKAKAPDRRRHDVDMGAVCVPHFGIHLTMDDYKEVRRRVESSVGFLDNPYVRFEGTEYQQETFFVEDPNFNVLEIKHLAQTDGKN